MFNRKKQHKIVWY